MAADQGEGFEHYRKKTRREPSMGTIARMVPWSELCAVIEPYFRKAGPTHEVQRDGLAWLAKTT